MFGGRAPYSYLLLHGTAFVLVMLGLLLFFALFLLQGDPDYLLVCLGCASSGLLLLPVLLRGGRKFDLMEPINFVLPAVFFGTTLKTMFIVLFPSDRTADFLMVGEPNRILFVPLLTICLSMLCLTLGYMQRVPRLPIDGIASFLSNRRWLTYRLRLLMIGSFLLSLACMLYYIRALGPAALARLSAKRVASDVENSGYILAGAAQLTYAVYLALAQIATVKSRTWFEKTFVVISGLLIMAFYTFLSTRTLLLNLVVYSMVLYHYLRRPVRVHQVLVGVLAVLFIVAFIGGLRPSKENHNPKLSDALDNGTSKFIDLAVNNRNYLGAPETAIIMNGVPKHLPFQNGGTLITWAYAPIPRTLWPQKPEQIRVGFMLSPLFKRGDVKTGATPGMVAELYLNYGFWGTFPVMFFVGVVLRTLYVSYRPYFHHKSVLLTYMVMMFPLSYNWAGADLSGALLYLIQGLTLTFLYVCFVSVPVARAG